MISFSRARTGVSVMPTPEFLPALIQPAASKLVLVVLDGLGGLPRTPDGLTELETARTPELDRFAIEGLTGLSEAVGPGITPGSGPGHLALFGYDPVASNIGRGALSALGLGLRLDPGDLAVRLNFCTLDSQGNVADRRAGRIATEENRDLVAALNQMDVDGARLEFVTESQHRAVLVIRGAGLDPRVRETDLPPHAPEPLDPAARRASELVQAVLGNVRAILGARPRANFVLMRGYAGLPHLPSIGERYGLRAACLATYPMYKGLARVAGMTVVDTGDTLGGQVAALERHWSAYDFCFVHIKAPDARGEDGDFDGKVAAIEEVDRALPRLRALQPDVLVVTGDHSTPATMRAHSWHPVPLLLWGAHVAPDRVEQFGERACAAGGLGVIPAQTIMVRMLAHGGRLAKFGA